MQPTTKAVLVAWVAMLQLAVAMPMADLGTARGGERSATRAGDPHPGAIHSIQEYNTRDVFPRPATFSEPAKSGPFQGDEGSIQARFTFARDGEHWVVVPPIARRTDFESARSEVVGQSLVAGEESADLRDISTAENVALVGRAYSKLACFTAIMTLSWGNDDGCSKNPKKATKLKISEVTAKRDVLPLPLPLPEERALTTEQREEPGVEPVVKRAFSKLACFTAIMTLSWGNDGGCSKNPKKATKLKVSEVSTKRDLVSLPQDEVDRATARATLPEESTTSELTERSGPLAERAPAAESEKVSARRKQTHREDDSRRDTESVAPQRYQVRSTDPGSRAAQERRELWAGLERTAKCIQAISSLFIWKPYRDGCIYDKPMHKREIAQLPLARRPYQEGDVVNSRPVVIFARHDDIADLHTRVTPQVGLLEEQSLAQKRGFLDVLNKGAKCFMAYGLALGTVPIYNEGCKNKKRNLASVQMITAQQAGKRDAVVNAPTSARRKTSLVEKRGTREVLNKGVSCFMAYGVGFGMIDRWKETCKNTRKRDLAPVPTGKIEKRSEPDTRPLFRFGQEKVAAERRNDVQLERRRDVVGCVMFVTTMIGDWNSCRSKKSRRKKAFKRPFKKAYDHIKYLY